MLENTNYNVQFQTMMKGPGMIWKHILWYDREAQCLETRQPNARYFNCSVIPHLYAGHSFVLSNVQPPSEVTVNARLGLLTLLGSYLELKLNSERHVNYPTHIK
jgi:hypothetical protein